ncbi:hypothetical protein AGMMS49975_13080 [Clostridia bacterium]|nr:hypothetical protein AGMMS49975_13080 [Clostridia bacterium]
MSEDKAKHTITIERKENVALTGVLDVLSFDEESVVADTQLGVVVVRGVSLHVNKLNLETGDLAVDGNIGSVQYEDNDYGKNKSSVFSKIFR